MVHLQPREALVDRLQHPAPRQAALVRPLAHGNRDLGRHNPAVAVLLEHPAEDALRLSLALPVAGADEVDPGVPRQPADAPAALSVGPRAEQRPPAAERLAPQAPRAPTALLHASV